MPTLAQPAPLPAAAWVGEGVGGTDRVDDGDGEAVTAVGDGVADLGGDGAAEAPWVCVVDTASRSSTRTTIGLFVAPRER